MVPADPGLNALQNQRVIDDSVPRPPDPERAPLSDVQRPGDGQTALPADAAEQTIVLTGVEVEGNDIFDDAALSGLWSAELGTEVTLLRLGDIADDVQAFYRAEGYVFTRAVLELDGFPGGVATIRVVEGIIGSVTVEESAEPVGPVKSLLDDMAAELEGRVSPHIHDLERVLLLMNDVPGITRATAIPRRSRSGEAGMIDIIINVERKAVNGVVFADNRQSPTTGPGLFGLAGELSSYSVAGDTTRLTATTSFWDEAENLDERALVQIEHSRHLTADGLKIFGRGLYSRSRLGEDLEPLDIRGDQIEGEIGLSYPILRTRPYSVEAFTSFTLVETESEVTDGPVLSDDSIRVFTVGLDGLMRDDTGFTAGRVELRQGLDLLSASDSGDIGISRTDGKANATVLYGEVEREQQVWGPFSLFAEIGGQWASRPLLATREFGIGGTTFGRGFDPSEFTGDHGWGASVEWRFTRRLGDPELFESDLELDTTLQVYSFFDFGQVFQADGGASEEISSFGGGFRLFLPRNIFLEFEVANPRDQLLQPRDNGEFIEGPRFFFSAQKQF
ncbi:MAG: ShlB/FhaC/HecB family hemolysin secretion/activation protein [Pseudomonadota bacterium]